MDPCTVHCSNARDVNFVSSCIVEQSGFCIDRFGRKSGLKNNLNVLAITAVEKIPAPQILTLNVLNSTKNIEINVQLTASGGVYCGVFDTVREKLPTSLDEIRVQKRLIYANETTFGALLNIENLLAATEYKLYCFNFNFIIKFDFTSIA